MKGDMLCDTGIGSMRVGEVEDEPGMGFGVVVVAIKCVRYELSMLQHQWMTKKVAVLFQKSGNVITIMGGVEGGRDATCAGGLIRSDQDLACLVGTHPVYRDCCNNSVNRFVGIQTMICKHHCLIRDWQGYRPRVCEGKGEGVISSTLDIPLPLKGVQHTLSLRKRVQW